MSKKQKIATPLLLSLVLAYVLTKIILSSDHNIFRLKNWATIKERTINTDLMGAMAYETERNVLHQNQLWLGKWHGFNGILTRTTLTPQSLSFRSRYLGKHSQFSIVLSWSEKEYQAIQLFSHPQKKSMYYRAEKGGKYLAKHLFEKHSPPPLNQWVDYRVTFDKNKIELFQNQVQMASWTLQAPLRAGHIGFLSGHEPSVVIDDVKIKNDDVDREEDFSPRNFSFVFFINFLVLLHLSLFLFFKLGKTKERVQTILFIHIGFFLYLLIYFSFDFYYWSGHYYYNQSEIGEQSYPKMAWRIERFRRSFFRPIRKIYDSLIPTARDHLPIVRSYLNTKKGNDDFLCEITPFSVEFQGAPSNSPHRYNCFLDYTLKRPKFQLALLGSSQTYGSGASDLDTSWAGQLSKKIFLALKQSCDVELINMSLSGALLMDLIPHYQNLSAKEQFDILLINLGSNDSGHSLLESAPHFFQKLSQGQTKVFVSLEPFYYQFQNQEKHLVLLTNARKYNYPVLNSHSHIHSIQALSTGHLWVDHYHFSDYGHSVMANYIFQQLKKLNALKCPEP